MSERDSRSLTRAEFDAVIRRAAELASADPDAGESSLTEAELFRIARDVGLPEHHVRTALAEVRRGGSPSSVLDRLFGPAHLHAARVVPGSPVELRRRIDDFLVASQLLQRVRDSSGTLQYRPAVDWASQLARAASFRSSKHFIASANAVEVRLEPLEEGRTYVELLVDPGKRRGHAVLGAGAGGLLVGGWLGALAGYGLSLVAPLGAAIAAGGVVGGGVLAAIVYAASYTHRKKLARAREEVEGVLDALESGADLEPPPPSWRRWIKRQFHGVARDPSWDRDARG